MGESMSEVPSPCNRVCTIDARTGLCIGCARSLDEISAWAMLTDAERRKIVDALASRLAGRAAIACSSCGARFACGAADREHPCWCASYPPVDPSEGGCLCPNCLRNAGTNRSI
jgi:hypothetical protein